MRYIPKRLTAPNVLDNIEPSFAGFDLLNIGAVALQAAHPRHVWRAPGPSAPCAACESKPAFPGMLMLLGTLRTSPRMC